VEIRLEVASACQWGFFDIPAARWGELAQPLSEYGEFHVSGLLVNAERVVGEKAELPVVVDTGNVEASDSKIDPPYGHLGSNVAHLVICC